MRHQALEAASFGVHIHVGKSCDSADEPGGHYFNGAEDPWTAATNAPTPYSATGEVSHAYMFSEAEVEEYGYNNEDTVGHVVVVHSATGDRIGCGKLEQMMSGIHIHSGPCTSADTVGGHYYNDLVYSVADDPWLPTKWAGIGSGGFNVDTGYRTQVYDFLSVVVHYGSSRVLCGNLVVAASCDGTGGPMQPGGPVQPGETTSTAVAPAAPTSTVSPSPETSSASTASVALVAAVGGLAAMLY